MAMYGAHDLLHIDPSGLHTDGEVPAWVQLAIREYPWVVVRREAAPNPGQISVGVRGASRSQRFAMQLTKTAVRECLPPWALVDLIDESFCASPFPALAALPALATLLEGWRWGPGGSVAFHLATGAACVHAGSDLDILLYPRAAVSQGKASELLRRIRSMIKNADVLIEMPEGAYALTEYADGKAPLLCRTLQGPALVQHPRTDMEWSPQPEDCGLRAEAG